MTFIRIMGCTDSRQSLKSSQSTSRDNKGSRGLQRRNRGPRGSCSEETRDETASSTAFGDCSSKVNSMEPEASAPESPLNNASSVVTERRATLAEMESLSDLDKTLTDENEDCDNGHSEGRCCCSRVNDTSKSDQSKPRTSAKKTASALNGSHSNVVVVTGEQNNKMLLQQKNHNSHSNSNTNRLAKVSNAQRTQDHESQNDASSNAKNTAPAAKAKPKSSSTKSHKQEKQKQDKNNARNDSSNKKSKSLRHHSKHSKAEDGEAAARDAHFQHQQQLGRQSSETARSLALGGLRSTLVDLAPYASAFVVVPLTLEQDAVGNLLKVCRCAEALLFARVYSTHSLPATSLSARETLFTYITL